MNLNYLLASTEIELFEEPMLGTVEMAIAPNQRGRVHCQGTYWPARFYHPDCQVWVQPEDAVRVIAREGITLLVMPVVMPVS